MQTAHKSANNINCVIQLIVIFHNFQSFASELLIFLTLQWLLLFLFLLLCMLLSYLITMLETSSSNSMILVT
jgi:hypothetical protein